MTQNKALEALEFIEVAYETTMLREAIPHQDEPHNELVKEGIKAVAHHIEIIRTELKVSNSTPLDNTEALEALNSALRHEISTKMFVISEDAVETIRAALTQHAALDDIDDIDPRTGVQRMIDIDFINDRLRNAISFNNHDNLKDAARAVVNHIRSGGNFGENTALKTENVKMRKTLQIALGHLTGGMDGDYKDYDPVETIKQALKGGA